MLNNINFKLAGCVILYNPDEEVITNIKSYIDHLDILYLIDNANGEQLIIKLSKLYYKKIKIIRHKENMGIAYSLNEVIKDINGSYEFLLTMDQDSRFIENSMKRYRESVSSFNWSNVLLIQVHRVSQYPDKLSSSMRWKETFRAITSGNIVCIKNANKIGAYDESLFIDEVDHEFCYRGRRYGYKIYENVEGVYLLHTMGNPTCKNICGIEFKYKNYNKIRKYYIFRNNFKVCFKYFREIGFIHWFLYYFCADFKFIFELLVFEKDKLEKGQYIFMGMLDFIRGRYGKRF